MISLNQVKVEKLKRQFPEIESKFDEDVAAFMLTVMNQETRPWMWKKHEIHQAGGEMAWTGFVKLLGLHLADHWRIDDVYVIAGELYILDIETIAIKAFGYKIKATEDGGYWLYRGYFQVDYYRRKGMAKRRALKEIHERIKEGRH
jgi:hypothetical protein